MSGALQVVFMNQRSFIPNPYYLGVLVPSSGDYYLQGGAYTVANSDGMFICGGDTSGGRIQKLKYDGTIGFQNFVTVSASSTYLQAITIPSSGNIYTAGYKDGSAGGAWVTKFNSSGSVTWSKGTPNLSYYVFSITTDSSENIYYAGDRSTGDYDTTNRIVVASLNSSGTDRWQTWYGSSQGFQSAGVSAYSTSVFVVGRVYQTGIYQTAGVLFKLAQSDGTLQSEKKYSDDTQFFSLAQSSSTGNCYIGAGGITGKSMVLKTDSSLAKQWGANVATTSTQTAVAIDSSENVYSLRTNSTNVLVICKHDSSGTIQWQRNLTLPYNFSGRNNIAVTTDGKIFVSTQMTQTSPSQYYPFVAMLNSDGSGAGTYTVNGQTYTYAASSYTTSTDSGSFSTSTYGVTAQSRTVNDVTTSSATDNLTFTRASL